MAGGSCYFTRLVRFYFMAGKFGGPALRRFCCFWVQMPISREGIGKGAGWGKGENLGGGGLFKKKKKIKFVGKHQKKKRMNFDIVLVVLVEKSLKQANTCENASDTCGSSIITGVFVFNKDRSNLY